MNTEVEKDDEVSLGEVTMIFGRWRSYLFANLIWLLAACLVGGALGLTYAALKRPIYKAQLTFALEDGQGGGGLGGALGLASQFGIDLGGGGGGAFAGDNVLELLKSRSMIEKALLHPIKVDGKVETLAERFINYNGLRRRWDTDLKLRTIQFPPHASRSSFTREQDSVLGTFYRSVLNSSLTVGKLDKKLSVVTVNVSSPDELFSKEFAEVLVRVVADFYIETKTKKGNENMAILQHQTDSVRRVLNSAISGVAISLDNNPNPNPGLQVLRVPSQKRTVDVQANQAILTELVKNLELAKVTVRRETPLIQVIDAPILPLEKDEIGRTLAAILGGGLGLLGMGLGLTIKKVFLRLKRNYVS